MEAATVALPDLKAERDRYVAFAFASADLLIEIDSHGAIVFASGAAQQLTGRGDFALLGTPVYDLFVDADRPLAAAEVAAVRHGGRSVPFPVRLASADHPYVVLGMCRLPDRPEVTFLALSLAVPAPTPVGGAQAANDELLARDSFATLASHRLASQPQVAYRLTLVALDGFAELRQRISEEVAAGIDAAIGRRMQSGGPDVEMTGLIGDGRYGILHQRPLDVARLRQAVESLAAAADPTGVGVVVHAQSMDLDRAGLSESDVSRAVLYSLQRFADADPGTFTVDSLRASLGTLMADAVHRVGALRSALGEGSFNLEYQPVVALSVNAVHHCEALARFPRGQSAATTVAFAEAVGLVSDFDLAVCDRVIKLLQARHAERLAVAVNVSGQSLESAVFTAALLQMLELHGALAPKLLFEVTESAAITRFDEVNSFLQVLRGRGFRLCLDDFGAGTNSFHYLRRFNVDFVKIDGQFVRQAANSEQDLACLRAVVALSRELGAATIAEMVETADQVAMLRRLGVEFGQGYLLGRPQAEPVTADFVPTAKRRPRRR